MSDLGRDPSWRDEAVNVARELDRGDLSSAQESMRQDLFQLQNDPRAQRQFLSMVDQYDRKGRGLDIQLSPGQRGETVWQIVDSRPPLPPPRRPDVVIVEPQRPSPGEIIIGNIFSGIGAGLGNRIGREIFDNDRDRGRHHHHHHDRRHR